MRWHAHPLNQVFARATTTGSVFDTTAKGLCAAWCNDITGDVMTLCRSAHDIPAFHNTRPIMVANDTRVFDLLALAPVAQNGWVLLGEVGRYVRVSK